jgi:AraC-like DNA-binding protein
MRLQQEVIYKKVCACMEKDKVYLDPRLSLVRLGVIVGTNTTYLSNAINNCFGRNFRTLVNDYRIRYAVNLIKNGHQVQSIRGLHLMCGFTSVSVFYDAFKRRVGISPFQLVRQVMTAQQEKKARRAAAAAARGNAPRLTKRPKKTAVAAEAVATKSSGK